MPQISDILAGRIGRGEAQRRVIGARETAMAFRKAPLRDSSELSEKKCHDRRYRPIHPPRPSYPALLAPSVLSLAHLLPHVFGSKCLPLLLLAPARPRTPRRNHPSPDLLELVNPPPSPAKSAQLTVVGTAGIAELAIFHPVSTWPRVRFATVYVDVSD